MNYLPFAFEPIAPTTWAYLSSLLMLALFFKFNRCWSIRNFDLFLIILLAPGLLMIDAGRRMEAVAAQQNKTTHIVESNDVAIRISRIPVLAASSANATRLSATQGDVETRADDTDSTPNDSPDAVGGDDEQTALSAGRRLQKLGYYWLFGVGVLFLLRLLFDPLLVRRPLLDPNLSIGGLVFLACSLTAFLVANVLTSSPTQDDLQGAENAVRLIQRKAAGETETAQLQRRGPGYTLFNLIPIIPSFGDQADISDTDPAVSENMSSYVVAARSLAITSQIFIIVGLILFCHYHYDNFVVGVGVATIYLMSPYTALYNGHVLHTLPAALVIWSLVCFRLPFLSGVLLGLATGVSYYPIFLLPLWCSFYWERGFKRFLPGVLISLAVCICGLIFTSVDVADFFRQLQAMFGFWQPLMDGLEGIWALGWSKWNRLPLVLGCIMLAISFVWWPTRKDLGTLVAYSAAIMVSVQFWHGFGGGLYIAWYLPLALLIFFRPNLSGRVASSELPLIERKAAA